jgi:hypothetical protein
MESLDISAAWLSLVWIALALGVAWLLSVLAERDAAASQPDQPSLPEGVTGATTTGHENSHIPGTSS